jgi:YbbR domain-containing protein
MDKWLNNANVVRIVSLLIGVLLWFIVTLDEKVSGDPSSLRSVQDQWIYNLDIEARGMSEQMRLISMEPSKVNILLRGRIQDLAKVNTRDGEFRIVADLQQASAGANSIPLRAEGIPSGVEVVYMDPSSIEVTLEQIVTKEFPVRVVLQGSPAEGHLVGEPAVRPDTVSVSAPESELSRISEIHATVDLDGASETVRGEYRLTPVTVDGKEVSATVAPETVQIEVPITLPAKTVPLVIRVVGTPPEGYSVSRVAQSVREVTVYGPQEALDEIETYAALTIPVNAWTESVVRTFDIPLIGGVLRVEPAAVEVEVDIVPATSRTLPDIPVEIVGVGSEYEAVFLTPENGRVSVSVQGAPAQLTALRADQVRLIADVSHVPPGEVEVVLQAELPELLELVETDPPSVRLEIRPKSEQ